MRISNEQLKSIYLGALRFEETADGYLQAFQYTYRFIRYREHPVSPLCFQRAAVLLKEIHYLPGRTGGQSAEQESSVSGNVL